MSGNVEITEDIFHIFTLIEKLSKEDKKAAQDFIAFQALSTQSELDRTQSDFVEAVLTTTNLIKHPNLTAQSQLFVKSYGRKAFEAKAALVEKYVVRSTAHGTKYIVRAEVTRKAVSALATHMHKHKILCNATTLLDNIDLMAEAVDLQFPNYAECRLLHMVAPSAMIKTKTLRPKIA